MNPLKHSNDNGDLRPDFKDKEEYKTPLNSPAPFRQHVQDESKYPTVDTPNVPESGRTISSYTESVEDYRTTSKESGRVSDNISTKGKVEVAGNHPNKKLAHIYG